jgi:transposase InsO family protein
MAKFNPPQPFDFTAPGGWCEWKKRFERYRVASKLHEDDEFVQVSALVYAMGEEAEQVFVQFGLSNDDSKKYDEVLKKFDEHFQPCKNIVHERVMFQRIAQQQSEGVESFTRSLYKQAEKCEFGDSKSECIRDRFVAGLYDKDVSEELQNVSKLTLEKAIEIARRQEAIKKHVQAQKGTAVEEVRHPKPRQPGHRGGYHSQQPRGRSRGASRPRGRGAPGPKPQASKCTRCDKQHSWGRCPAIHEQCHKCRKWGHFAVCCRSQGVREVQAEPHESVYVDTSFDPYEVYGDVFYMDTVTADKPIEAAYEEPWLVSLPICGSDVEFKVDSGADVTTISEKCYESLKKKPKLKPPSAGLKGADKSQLRCIGQFKAETVFKNSKYLLDIQVCKDVSNLLSRTVSKAMGILKLTINEVDSSVFGDSGRMKGQPVEIELEENVKPFHINTPRRVPFPLLEKVKAELERMEATGIIEKVTEPTEWCSPLVVTLKKNRDIRLCVDLRQLNRAVKRERYILPTVEDITAKLAGMEVFTTLDATGGYHQMPLSHESTRLTTFMTPYGRYCFRRMPFGISSASEIFQRKMQEILGHTDGVAHFQDDIIIAGKTVQEHDRRLDEVLQKLKEAGVKLNKDKCMIRRDTVEYLGHRVDKRGITPDPNKVKAVNDMPPPTCLNELRRILGMIKYLGRFVPDMATVLQPISDNLKSDSVWTWGPRQETAFQTAKDLITKAPVLAYYDVTKPTVVSADSSSYGLGAVLMQMHGNQLRPIAFASRTLTEAEKRYAQIEKECLASVWACERFDRYLCGLPSFRLMTDHKPLVPLINGPDLNKVPLRCQRLLMRLMRYRPVAEHIKGKDMWVSDTLSRHPLEMPSSEMKSVHEIEQYVEDVKSQWPMSDRKLAEMQKATAEDPVLTAAMQYTIDGWPTYGKEVPDELKEYFDVRAHLSVAQGLLIYDDRIVIPQSKRKDVLQCIHEGHMGIDKCRDRANTGVWWRGITAEIKKIVKSCEHCQIYKCTQQKEPLQPTPLPDGPWQRVATDLLEENGRKYIVVVDYYSRYIELLQLYSTTSSAIIQKLKSVFARWGIPLVLVSDNGPQFSAKEFKDFAEDYGFEHETTSPHHHQANGAAERAVQTAKRILKQEDPLIALMTYRATPVKATGHSPSHLAMGRQIRTKLPTLQRKMTTVWPDKEKVRQNDEQAKQAYSYYYNRHHGVHPRPELKPGHIVRIKTDEQKQWSAPARVIQTSAGAPRSVLVKCQNGNILRRNRRHLQWIPNTQGHTTPVATSSGSSPSRQSPRQRAQSPPIRRVPGQRENSPVHNADSPVHQTQITPRPTSTNSSQIMPQRRSNATNRHTHVHQPATVVTTKSGRTVKKPIRFDDYV